MDFPTELAGAWRKIPNRFEIPATQAKICGNSGAVGVPMDVYRKIKGKRINVIIEVIE